jgi:hypothetical protein
LGRVGPRLGVNPGRPRYDRYWHLCLPIIGEVAAELSRRLCRIFLRGEDDRRPVFGDSPIEQEDAHFRDNVLFYEFFHGDTGRGLGASHQTGWTALIAWLLRSWAPTATGSTTAELEAVDQ